ncbi:unnamed protein product [Callosobruchus maculatus]|uniref:C2H2-type domain-containing protein n=1 Tax=Callosobruchus maculatus TaxID=64391 RepID=A0A653CD25_CALMS|nr:unnamed protein product [Callosobruchus maculatus]
MDLKGNDRDRHMKVKKCRVCPELQFTTEKEYLLHIRDEHEGKIIDCHMCNVCGKTFKTHSELTQHIKSKCGTERRFICKECGQSLMSAGSLYNHVKRHQKTHSYMCRFCAKMFVTGGQLKVHEKVHTQQKDFVCEICNKGFCHRQSLITHITIHTGIKPYQCEGCSKSFSCVGNLLKHRKTHEDTCGLVPMTSHRVKNPSTKIKVRINTPASSRLKQNKMRRELKKKLEMLDKEFDQNVVKSGHTTKNCMEERNNLHEANRPRDVNETEEKCIEVTQQEFCCEEDNSVMENTQATKCDNIDNGVTLGEAKHLSNGSLCEAKENKKHKNSKEKESLKLELERFVEDRKLVPGSVTKCKYCSKEYTNFKWLFRHENAHEQNKGNANLNELSFKCSCCQAKFDTKEAVKQHQSQAHADVLTCGHCSKPFSNVDSLRSHIKAFHKGQPRKPYTYVCQKCGKTFKQKALLEAHMSTDCDSESRFMCHVCNKSFSTRHTLWSHMRLHVAEKGFKCGFCDKGFHWKGQLKVHERSHTGEKPYTCLFCPSSFAYRDSLVTHSTLHTGLKPYVCKCCGWRFSCVGNLVKHKSTHGLTCGMWYKENEED